MGHRGVSVGAVMIAAVGAASAGAFSCRQIVGIEDEPAKDLAPTTSACGLPWGTSTCAACIDASCCDEASACASDVPCAQHFRCLGSCASGDWKCRAQCGVDHPFDNAAEWPALTGCAAARCENACGLTCGGIAPSLRLIPPVAAPACEACLETHDCAATRSCASSASCDSWMQCWNACSTPDCKGACSIRYGYADAGAIDLGTAGPGAFASLVGRGACSDPCAAGSNWSCVGHVVWPQPTVHATTLRTQVLDIVTRTPVAAVDAALCTFLDPTCLHPLAVAQSDPSGFVTLPVAPPPSGLPGLAADSFVLLTSAATAPALYFLGYPVSEALAPVAEPYAVVGTLSELQVFAPPDASIDPSRGEIGFVAYDCDGAPGVDVQVTLDPTDSLVRGFYYRGNAPDYTATATDGSGFGGGFVNVKAGTVNVTATPLGRGAPSSRGHVQVVAGAVSTIYLFPTP